MVVSTLSATHGFLLVAFGGVTVLEPPGLRNYKGAAPVSRKNQLNGLSRSPSLLIPHANLQEILRERSS